jgi:hypothetical protein
MNIILSVVLYLYRTFVCMFITVQRHLLVLPMANWLLLWIIDFTLPNRLFYKKNLHHSSYQFWHTDKPLKDKAKTRQTLNTVVPCPPGYHGTYLFPVLLIGAVSASVCVQNFVCLYRKCGYSCAPYFQ